jgi:glycosyltransferase involved in cell wall biosynthesis
MKKLPPRLAIFLPALYGGGAERAMLKLAHGILERGYLVDLVLVHKAGPYISEIPPAARAIILGSSRDIFSLLPLMRYLRNEQPDVLLSGLYTNMIAIWAKKLAGVPTRVVVSERNTLSQNVRFYSADLRMRLMPFLVRSFYPQADGIVAVSKGVAADLVQLGKIPPEKIRVIYNPVVTDDLRQKANLSVDHPWFGPGKLPVVLAVGRLTAQKDFASLIKAFAIVRQNHYLARLLILGEGEQRPVLEELIQNLSLGSDVSMPGFVSNPYSFMTNAALFVLSSRWEGLPGVLIEAMACGTPLVSTDCPSGPHEILAEGKYGRLVPVGDVNALAQAIQDGLMGRVPRPPKESWQPFEPEYVLNQYVKVLFGNP